MHSCGGIECFPPAFPRSQDEPVQRVHYDVSRLEHRKCVLVQEHVQIYTVMIFHLSDAHELGPCLGLEAILYLTLLTSTAGEQGQVRIDTLSFGP